VSLLVETQIGEDVGVGAERSNTGEIVVRANPRRPDPCELRPHRSNAIQKLGGRLHLASIACVPGGAQLPASGRFTVGG